jgi:hypothetical protein
MLLIPYKKIVISTRLDQESIFLELENIIEPRTCFFGFGYTQKPFKGIIKRDRFKIKLSNINPRLGNFSPPVLIGKLEDSKEETKITIVFRLCLSDMLFIGFLIGTMIINLYFSHFPYGIMIVPIVIIGFMLVVFNYYSKESVEILLRQINPKN